MKIHAMSPGQSSHPAATPRVWLHVSSLMRWQRAAVGVVRVECEYARWLLSQADQAFAFCEYRRERGQFVQVPADAVARQVAAITAGQGGAQVDSAATSTPAIFSPGDRFISLGLDWDTLDHRVLWQHRQAGLHITLMCYDLIPVLYPQWFAGVHTRDTFSAYLADLCWCADQVLCISEHTQRDLLRTLPHTGVAVPPTRVVRLGCEVPRTAAAHPPARLTQGDDARPFVLFVSTIERRKNHELLYRAWARLREQAHAAGPGDGFVPHRLVFAGMPGWGVSDLLKDIELDPRTQADIVMLNHVSDAELAWLYQHCAFTVFPSLHEGWGLPVAESLAHGKFCLCSNAASLPEVGGQWCEYLDPWDLPAWVDRLGHWMRHPQALQERNQHIAQQYRPTPWAHTAQQIHAAVLSADRRDTHSP